MASAQFLLSQRSDSVKHGGQNVLILIMEKHTTDKKQSVRRAGHTILQTEKNNTSHRRIYFET